MQATTFLLGGYVVGFQVPEGGKPEVTFAWLRAVVMSIPGHVLAEMQPPEGESAGIETAGLRVDLTADELAHLREAYRSWQAISVSGS